jgi:hypothetical protein
MRLWTQIWDMVFAPVSLRPSMSSDAELPELVDYEEMDFEEEDFENLLGYSGPGKYLKHMHYYVPPNPFKATVRLHRRPKSKQTTKSKSGEFFFHQLEKYPYTMPLTTEMPLGVGMDTEGEDDSSADHGLAQAQEDYDYDFEGLQEADDHEGPDSADNTQTGGAGVHSPYSFPPTPTSRIDFLNRSAEKVDTVMFIARDWLRVQAQSDSVDAHTRTAALKAQTLRRFAVFDSRSCGDGIALSCGNHSAMKVGQEPCASVRSVIPIADNTYVYVEFTVSVTGGVTPKLSVGLSNLDFSLSNEVSRSALLGCVLLFTFYIPSLQVGFSPGSVGFSSSGLLSIGSSSVSFNGVTCGLRECQIQDESTVGILVYRFREQQQPLTDRSETKESGHSISTGSEESEQPSAQLDSSTHSDHDGKSRTLVVVNVNGIILPFSQSAQQLISQEFEQNAVSPLRLASCSASDLIAGGNSSSNAIPPLETVSAANSNGGCLFPTVSLLSANDTRVYCRFSDQDMVQRRRSSIGAPVGCRVYCLDGTQLLREQSL